MPDFLDKIVGGLNKGVASVSANSKAMVERTKVNSTMAALERERGELFGLLGQKVYDTYKDAGHIDPDSIVGFIGQIDARNEQLAQEKQRLIEIEAELRRVTGAVGTEPITDGITCSCGHVNAKTAKFCAGCGGKIE